MLPVATLVENSTLVPGLALLNHLHSHGLTKLKLSSHLNIMGLCVESTLLPSSHALALRAGI